MGILSCLKTFFTPYEPRFGENGQLFGGVDKPSLIFVNMVMARVLQELPSSKERYFQEEITVTINGSNCVLNFDDKIKLRPIHVNSLTVFPQDRATGLRTTLDLGSDEKQAIADNLNRWRSLKAEADKNRKEFERQQKALDLIQSVFTTKEEV